MKPQETLSILNENVEISLPENAIAEKLQVARLENRKLIIKLGFDPTAPDLHLGHAVVLKKLKQFQDLGHTIVIIIGDFTARIGDPTGKNKSRPPLNAEQVKINAQTYVNQLNKILDISKCEIRYNSEWLEQMGLQQTIQLLSQVTLAQIMQRTDFNKRFTRNMPIAMHELMYPMLQGHDSVQINADIEMGGTDQLFNCTMGRQLQEQLGKPAQAVLCMPLLRGIDGSAKMSKSEGNIVGLTDVPEEMFGKIMSVPDDLINDYILLATSFSIVEKHALIESMQNGVNPMQIKKIIASNIIQQYHNDEQARAAQHHFETQFQQRDLQDKLYEIINASSLNIGQTESPTLLDVCKGLKEVMSKSHLRRLVESGGVAVNGAKITDPAHIINLKQAPIKIKLGKREYFELVS